MIEVASAEAADKLATELEKLAPLEGQPDPPCAETLANCPNLGAFLKKRMPLEDMSFLVSVIQCHRTPHLFVWLRVESKISRVPEIKRDPRANFNVPDSVPYLEIGITSSHPPCMLGTPPFSTVSVPAPTPYYNRLLPIPVTVPVPIPDNNRPSCSPTSAVPHQTAPAHTQQCHFAFFFAAVHV